MAQIQMITRLQITSRIEHPLCDQHQNRRRAAVCPSRNDALSCHDQPDGIESVHSLVR
jgi:hypothetical protein